MGIPFKISIRPFHLFQKGICGVRIHNLAPTTSTFTVTGHAQDERIQFAQMPPQVSIPAGQRGALCVKVFLRNRPFFGNRRTIYFTINVQSMDGIEQSLPGQLEYTPMISLWQLGLLLVSLGLSLGAVLI